MKSSETIRQELLKLWNISELKFEAQFIVTKKGHSQFTNIRRISDQAPLIFPNDTKIYISAKKADYNINKHYIIRCFVASQDLRAKLGKEYLLTLDRTFIPEEKKTEPRKFVEKLMREYDSIKGIPLTGLKGAVKRISYDINKKPETFIFELLQNADDYPENEGSVVHTRFVIKDEYLLFMHNGLPFTTGNVEAICTIDAGDKRYDFQKTGYKGIGFKSIFKYSNYVLINSGGFCFRFDEDYHTARGKDTFWQLIPIWTRDDELSGCLKTPWFLDSKVSIAIRPKQGTEMLLSIEKIFDRIFKDERVLLFLRHVKTLTFEGQTASFKRQITSNKWLISSLPQILVDEQTRKQLNNAIEKGTDERIPEKFKDLQSSQITFAVEIDNGKLKPTENPQIFTYLPTDLNLGFNFLLNGDFIPDGGRHYLHADLEWNHYLFYQSGYKLIEWLQQIWLERKHKDYLRLLPNTPELIKNAKNEDERTLLTHFQDGLIEGIKQIPFIPNRHEVLTLTTDLIFDQIEIIQITGPEIIESFWPHAIAVHPDIQYQNHIIILIQNGIIEGRYFELTDLSELLGKAFFSLWLKNIANQTSFHTYLHEKKWHNKFTDSTIFLTSKLELQNGSKIYYDLGGNEKFLEWRNIPTLHPELSSKFKTLDLPLKQWNILDFINTYVLDEMAINNELIRSNGNNKAFFQFIIKHLNELPASIFTNQARSLRTCWFFKHGDTLLFNSNNPNCIIVPYNEKWKDLFTWKVFPSDKICMLGKMYTYPELPQSNLDAFHAAFSIKPWDSPELPKLLIQLIIDSQSNIWTQIQAITGNGQTQTILTEFWQLLAESWKDLPNEYKKSKRVEIGKLPALTISEKIKPLNELYLSSNYTKDKSLEELLTEFPTIEASFLSTNLISAEKDAEWWKKLLSEWPIRKNTYDFLVAKVLPSIKTLGSERLTSITHLLLKYRNKLAEDNHKLTELPILCRDGILRIIENVQMGFEYTDLTIEKAILPSVSINHCISPKYLEIGRKSEWVDFFRSISIKSLQSNEDIIKNKISSYVKARETSDPENQLEYNIRILEELYDYLMSYNEPLPRYVGVMSLNTENGWKPACLSFLNSDYNPTIDFKKHEYTDTSINFVSNIYIEKSRLSPKDLKKVFLSLRVRESIQFKESDSCSRASLPIPYREAIDKYKPSIAIEAARTNGMGHQVSPYIDCNPLDAILLSKINHIFWNKLKSDESWQQLLTREVSYTCPNQSFNIANYVLWFIKNNKTVPNKKGELCIPKTLYSQTLNNYQLPPEILVADGFDDLKIGSKSLAEHLGIKTKPDFAMVIQFLLTKPKKITEKDLWEIVAEKLQDVAKLDKHEVEIWNKFGEEAMMPNKYAKWTPKNELFVLKDLEVEITQNHECNLYWRLQPYSKHLGIRELFKSDFKFNPLYPKQDDAFISVLREKLKFMALVIAKKGDYENILEKIVNILQYINITEVKRIEWRCDIVSPIIVYSDQHYFFDSDTNTHYHVGSWNSCRSSLFLEKIYDALGFSGSALRLPFFLDILLWSDFDILDELQKLDYIIPESWLHNIDIDEQSNIGITNSISQNLNAVSRIDENSKAKQKQSPNNADQDLSTEEVNEIARLLGRMLNQDEMTNAWIIAFYRAIKHFQVQNYDTQLAESNFEEALQKRMMTISGIDKSLIRVIVRSAKNGILRLNYSAWFELSASDTVLFVLTGNQAGQHMIFDTQEALLRINQDSIVCRLDGEDKYTEFNELLSGKYQSENKKFAAFQMLIRLKAGKEFESIFTKLYAAEEKNDFNDLDY